MRVLMIHCAYQFRGGEDTVVEEEIGLLQNAGVTVELLRFSNEGNSLLKLLGLPFNLGAYRKVRQKIKDFRPDVVHVHNLHFAASPSVVYAVKHSVTPLVCTLHNYRLICPSASLCDNGELFLDSIQQTFPIAAVKRGVFKNSKLLTLWLALSIKLHHWLGTWKMPDRIILLSKHAHEIFMQSRIAFKPEQLTIKPNFTAALPVPPVQKTEAFLFVGRLTVEKGLRVLLEAFASSKHNLAIAGDGPLKEEVIAVSERCPNIRYAGSLPKEDVLSLMRQSSALVFPSVWFEGMPLTIIEAFASGTPVIASNMGAMPYMIEPGSNGLLFSAGDAQDLLATITRWAALPADEKAAYAANARAAYEQQYTPEKNKEQLLALYTSLQKAPAPGSFVLPHSKAVSGDFSAAGLPDS